jgi:hypothetical protein
MKRKLRREEVAQIESAYTREGDEGVLFLLVRLMGLRHTAHMRRNGASPATRIGNVWAEVHVLGHAEPAESAQAFRARD